MLAEDQLTGIRRGGGGDSGLCVRHLVGTVNVRGFSRAWAADPDLEQDTSLLAFLRLS